MRRLLLTFIAIATLSVTVAQQSVVVVDSEKIFKSIPEYNAALEKIDQVSKERQLEVDAKFAEVERIFNEYTQQRASITPQGAQQVEAYILQKEKEATDFQESNFSQNGEIIKMRMELIAPIQTKVFGVIDEYAKAIGADIVIDKAANSSLLFNSTAADHTQQIISKLK